MKRKLMHAFMIMLGVQAVLCGLLILFAVLTTGTAFPWLTLVSFTTVSLGSLASGLFTAAHFWKAP